jgi:hypothetical protein
MLLPCLEAVGSPQTAVAQGSATTNPFCPGDSPQPDPPGLPAPPWSLGAGSTPVARTAVTAATRFVLTITFA